MSDIIDTGGFDPNVPSHSKELATVIRHQQELQNKVMRPGAIGEVLATYTRAAINLREQSQRMAVTSKDAFARAGALLKAVKDQLTKLDDDRKKFTAPILAMKSAVDALFKSAAQDDMQATKTDIETKMRAYQREVEAEERRRAEEARKAQEEAALAAAAALSSKTSVALAEGLATADISEPPAPAPAAPVEAFGVTTQVVKRKRVVIKDLIRALAYISQHSTPSEAEGIVTLNSRALTSFVTRMQGGELKLGAPGDGSIEVIEDEASFRNL